MEPVVAKLVLVVMATAINNVYSNSCLLCERYRKLY